MPAGPAAAHKGWRSRGYLPHCDAATLVQHIVFGLADSLPPGAAAPWAMHIDRMLDNPVKAKLADLPKDWKWSSARWRLAGEDAGGPRR